MFVLSMGLVGLGNTWNEKLLKSMIQVCGVRFEQLFKINPSNGL